MGPRTVVPTLPLLTVTLLIVSGTGGPAGAGTPVGTPTVDPWFDGPHGAARPASPASVNNATWNWTNFANVTPGYDIPARAYAGLAAYPPGNEVIAFGGAAANGTALGDTWAFGPNWTWTPVSASTAPSARVGPLMAYDAPADAVILFGGRNGSGTLLRDTWSFSGGQWTLLRTGPPPPARSNATLVPDANGTGLILFGGNGSKGLLNDTWWFNETGGVPHWTNLTPTAGAPPPARYAAACANLSAPAEDVLYGGNSTLGELADTWVFNGSVWRAVTTRSNPGVRAGAAMGFDQVDGVDVLFGGYSAKTGTIIGSTSVFNGSAWNVPNIGAVHPHPRVGGAMAWAGGFAGGIALLLGGTYGTGTALGG
ncbi:MAG TPA: kelch repeat-containing protein, partial [Thermoplasmata archaeon]|nr:kelch repeat-containing protein [Thermoplasmata archaeon]